MKNNPSATFYVDAVIAIVDKPKIAMIISFISIFVGVLVSVGWVLDLPFLKNILPNTVTMKFSTSICFVFSGITVYSLAKHRQGNTGMAQIAIPTSGLVISLFMLVSLFSVVVSLDVGIRNLFVKDDPDALYSVLPGIPSIPTMISFILIVGAGIFALTETRLTRFFPHIGYAITIIGMISLVGYITNQPALYYHIPNVSTAMAIHTSMLFVLLGIAIFFLNGGPQQQKLKSVTIQTKLVFLFLSSSLIPLSFVLSIIFDQLGNIPNSGNLLATLIVIWISTAMIISIFAFLISRTISKPILSLRDVAQKISNGDTSSKAEARTDDEIGELGKIQNQMVANIIKNEKLSTIGELAARLTHDIKNPLSIIKANAELLQKYQKESQPEKLESRVNAIFRATERIARQIDDVLDFVRIKPLDLSRRSVLGILTSAVQTTPVLENVKVILPENDLEIECDDKQLVVVFSNMIMNSAQTLDGDGTITINLRGEQEHVVIEIIDTGSGIKPENLDKIFEPLFTTKQTGTGLGLVTCKNIIQQHHGTISVKNSPTTFTISLPVNQ